MPVDTVREQFSTLANVDVNGKEMCSLYKFLKRGSPLFVPRFGRANRIMEDNVKFVCNRYGQMKTFHASNASSEEISTSIEQFLQEEFDEERYFLLLNPPDKGFSNLEEDLYKH